MNTCTDCNELVRYCRCGWFVRQDCCTSSESCEPKYKATDVQSSRFLTGRPEQEGSLGAAVLTPQRVNECEN